MKRNLALILMVGLVMLIFTMVLRQETTAVSLGNDLADLRPGSLSGLPRTVYLDKARGQGVDLSFEWDFTNLGVSDADGFDVSFYMQSIDDASPPGHLQAMLHRHINNAPPGKAQKRQDGFHVPFSLYEGDGAYLIITQIDSENQVQETDEENNFSVSSVFLTADMPDLEVLGAIHVQEVGAGEKLTVSWNYWNRGTMRSKPTTATVLLRSVRKPHKDVWELGRREIPRLGPRVEKYWENDSFVIPADVPEGEYDLVWLIDDEGRIEESIEENEWVSGNGPIWVRH